MAVVVDLVSGIRNGYAIPTFVSDPRPSFILDMLWLGFAGLCAIFLLLTFHKRELHRRATALKHATDLAQQLQHERDQAPGVRTPSSRCIPGRRSANKNPHAAAATARRTLATIHCLDFTRSY
jgi:hypothetical protein